MAQYEITHKCGHKSIANITGPDKNGRRQWIADQKADELCYECAIAERNAAAVRNAETLGLPTLTGSEKQVTWATSLRQSIIDEMDRLEVKAGEIPQSWINRRATLLAQSDAKFWIDNRELTAMQLMSALEAK